MDRMEDIIAKLGLKGMHLLTGLLGGAVALIFGKKRNTIPDKIHALCIVLAGAVCTAYFTPMLFVWKPSFENAEHGIAFVIGIFGMGIIEGIMNIVYKFKDNPIDTFKYIFDVFRKR